MTSHIFIATPIKAVTRAARFFALEWLTGAIVLDVFVFATTAQDPRTFRHNEEEVLAGTALGAALVLHILRSKLLPWDFIKMTTTKHEVGMSVGSLQEGV